MMALVALATAGCLPLFDIEPEPDYINNDTDDQLPTCEDGRWSGDFYYEGHASAQDLAGCTYIQGSLYVDGTEVSDLYGLEYITTVGQSLYIVYSDHLFDLDGLDSLIEVEGNLVIQSNYSLHDLQGLDNLIDVGGDLVIESNENLFNLTGLEKLSYLSGNYFNVNYNPHLPSCEAQALAGHLVANGFTGTVNIYGNDDQTSCE